MRKLSTVLAGLVLAVTMSSPAWADTVAHRHHDFNGQSDSPGQGHSRYDQGHHDDDGSILF
jgi:hypothetical protein